MAHAEIRRAAEELLRTVLAAQCGAARPRSRPARPLRTPADHALHREWLRHQQLDYEAASLASRKLTSERDLEQASEEGLLSQLEGLKQQLNEIAGERQRELLLVDRINKSLVVSNAVYDADSASRSAIAASIADTCVARDGLLVDFLKRKKELTQMQDELAALQKANQILREENRALVTRIKSVSETQTNQPSRMQDSEQERLQAELARNSILRNVFQALIVASGVDWARDVELQTLLLSLEQPPE
eukprot:m.39594 g.39594  ORF g.39594 m.39594 type:complete len:247 (+) comp11791_c0_seq1:71-811(+)